MLMADGQAEPIRRLNPPELGTPPGYSQIVDVRAGRIIFIAGQTALDRNGELVGGNDFTAQADQVFRNLSAALQSVGCTASDLVKLTVFLRDMGHLPTYREARNRFFATVASYIFPVPSTAGSLQAAAGFWPAAYAVSSRSYSGSASPYQSYPGCAEKPLF